MKRSTTIVASAAISFFCFALRGADAKQAENTLWAAISVNQPVFEGGWTKNLQLNFAVVNDGKTTTDPKIGSSHLFINSQELKDWAFIVGNGPRSSNYHALPPGDSTSFGYAMGDKFKTPGIYKVRWESKNLSACEVTFRVLPKMRK